MKSRLIAQTSNLAYIATSLSRNFEPTPLSPFSYLVLRNYQILPSESVIYVSLVYRMKPTNSVTRQIDMTTNPTVPA